MNTNKTILNKGLLNLSDLGIDDKMFNDLQALATFENVDINFLIAEALTAKIEKSKGIFFLRGLLNPKLTRKTTIIEEYENV